jgi:amino acid adenylation domain-containing protein
MLMNDVTETSTEGATASLLAKIWTELLGAPAVSEESSFFELGGHSLQAIRLVGQIARQLKVRLPMRAVFDNPRLRDLADLIDGQLAARSGNSDTREAPGEVQELAAPLSSFQGRIWLAEHTEPVRVRYNVSLSWNVHGRLDAPVLGRALALLVERHEILRTRFISAGDELRQIIGGGWVPDLEYADLTGLAADARRERIEETVLRIASQPFDLESGQLLRAGLLLTGSDEQILVLCLHHLIHDGESTPLLVRELDRCYRAALLTRWPMAEPTPLRDQSADADGQADGTTIAASSFQQRVWLAERMAEGVPHHNIALAWRVAGHLDGAVLGRSIAAVIDRHEILRSRFAETDAGRLVQITGPGWTPVLQRADLRALAPAAASAEVTRRLLAALDHRFDPASGRLLAAGLFDVSDDEQVLLLVLHHLVFDGGSVPAFLRDLDRCYRAADGGEQPAPPPVQYRDFVRRRLAERDSEASRDGLAYWESQLRDAPAYLPLGDQSNGPDGVLRLPLPGDLAARLQRLRAECGVTTTMAAAAALAIVLHRETRLEDIAFGCPIGSRGFDGEEELIGPCLNMVALRSRITPRTTVRQLLLGIRGQMLDAFDHQHVPYDEVIERLNPPRRRGWIPYADVTLAIHDASTPETSVAGLGLTAVVADQAWAYTVKAGMSMTLITLDDDRLDVLLSYRGDRFLASSAAVFAGRLGSALGELSDRLDRPALDAGPTAVPVQYRDFVQLELSERDSQDSRDALAYWEEQLRGAPVYLPLGEPADGPDGIIPIRLPADVPERLQRLRAERGVTTTMAAAAALAIVLHRWTAQDDVVFGLPTANRPEEFAGALGPYVNTVVMRSRLDPATTAGNLLSGIRDNMLDALEHQGALFESVVERLNPFRRLNRTPYLDVHLSMEYEPASAPSIAGSALDSIDLNTQGAGYIGKLALGLVCQVSATGFTARLIYRGDMLTEADAQQLARLIGLAIERLADGLGQPVRTFNLMDAAERARLAALETGPPAAPRTSVPALLAQSFRHYPQAIAVEAEAGSLSYADLETRAQELAARLRPLVREHRDAVVALVLERGHELVVAMLAVWLAGAAFCPVDPEYPAERLDFILRDIDARALLTSGASQLARFGDGPVPVVDVASGPPTQVPARALAQASADDLVLPGPDATAYILHTSGTTGQPKGAVIRHGSLAQLARWYSQAYGLGPSDRVANVFSVGFDGIHLDLWPCLISGACLVTHEDRASVAELSPWLAQRRISVAMLPSTLAESIWTSSAPLPLMRWLNYGGGARRTLPPRDAPYRNSNLYGLSETTVAATADVQGPPSNALNSIGRPIAGSFAYVVDESGARCPVGIPGEILLSGACLGAGYWQRPELTAAAFIDRGADGERVRVMRTGDRGRWLTDGTLEFRGRVDRQLELQGFRVEPQEIEGALADDPRVDQVIVVGDADRSPALVAYVVPSAPGGHDSNGLLVQLRNRLPHYMIPEAIVWLAELPVTTQGKIDERGLPLPSRKDLVQRSQWAAPATSMERQIAAIWSAILGGADLGTRDNFFDLGGNSLKLVRLREALERELDREVPIQRLFEYPTVAAFSGWAESAAMADTGAANAGAAGADDIRRRAQRARQARQGRDPNGGTA